ncbi:MAG: outer membrane beta-barrel protein [Gemmatimonadetes bacterium]|nr:outer membrane beta-barrel protein [Gemmatimonadota bacterium]
MATTKFASLLAVAPLLHTGERFAQSAERDTFNISGTAGYTHERPGRRSTMACRHRQRRRLYSLLILAAVAAAPLARPLHAQTPLKAYGGLDVGLAVPVGEFRQTAPTGFADLSGGGSFFGGIRWGWVGLRVDVLWFDYGEYRLEAFCDEYNITLTCSSTATRLVKNGSLSLLIGPELIIGRGPVRPYLQVGYGPSQFMTGASLPGSERTDADLLDNTFTTALNGGLWIHLTRKFSLEVGARYLRNGRVRRLEEGSLSREADGSISVNVTESEANVLFIQVGVAITI